MNLLFESCMTKTATRLPHLILSERACDAQPYLSLNLTLPYEINQFQSIYVPTSNFIGVFRNIDYYKTGENC